MRIRRSAPSRVQTSLGFTLKFLNYLENFVGVSMIIYSCLMLNHWHQHKDSPSTPSPSLAPSPSYFSFNHNGNGNGNGNPDLMILGPPDVTPLYLNLDFALDSGFPDGFHFNFRSLPTPWFIYAFMGVGILLCCISSIGHIAAEAINGCCLLFYALVAGLLLILEISLVAFIAVDHQWKRDIPPEYTGELDRLREFIEEHPNICMWIGICVLTIQAFSLLLSILLKALVSRKADHDIEESCDTRERAWEPLLSPHTAASLRGESGGHFDTWSSRMRQKYGSLLSGNRKQNLQNQNER